MKISIQNGNLIFNNARFYRGLMTNDFLAINTNIDIEKGVVNEGWESYSFRYAIDEHNKYAMLVSFHNNVLRTVSISVGHPGSTWDDETPERIESDGQILRQLIYDNFDGQNRNQSFEWGKVELGRDFKSSFEYSIVVTYN